MRRFGPAAAIAVVFLVAMVLGIANPVRPSSVRTDALGPDNDETAEQYLGRASSGSGDGERWALVSFVRSMPAAEVLAVMDGVRVSVVYVHVPLPRVQTPVIDVAVPDTDVVVARSVRDAATLVPPGSTERSRAVAAVVRDRLISDCACVAGVLVRADVARLSELGADTDVRVLEALPEDAVFGRFAVTPLFPERSGDAAQPDDGPVPSS